MKSGVQRFESRVIPGISVTSDSGLKTRDPGLGTNFQARDSGGTTKRPQKICPGYRESRTILT